jgi:hypothetical protein
MRLFIHMYVIKWIHTCVHDAKGDGHTAGLIHGGGHQRVKSLGAE